MPSRLPEHLDFVLGPSIDTVTLSYITHRRISEHPCNVCRHDLPSLRQDERIVLSGIRLQALKFAHFPHLVL